MIEDMKQFSDILVRGKILVFKQENRELDGELLFGNHLLVDSDGLEVITLTPKLLIMAIKDPNIERLTAEVVNKFRKVKNLRAQSAAILQKCSKNITEQREIRGEFCLKLASYSAEVWDETLSVLVVKKGNEYLLVTKQENNSIELSNKIGQDCSEIQRVIKEKEKEVNIINQEFSKIIEELSALNIDDYQKDLERIKGYFSKNLKKGQKLLAIALNPKDNTPCGLISSIK